MFYTYAHYTPQGRLFYIGKGQGNRAYKFSKRNEHWNRVVAKHGKPEVQILAHWDTEQGSLDHEILLIDCFKDLGHKLCNQTNGGDGISGYRHTNDHRKKASQFHTGNTWRKGFKHTEERKQKISDFFKGHKYCVGITHSVEHRQKNSNARIGNKSALGYLHSEEFKKRVSAKLLGSKNAQRTWKWIGTHMITGSVISFDGSTALIQAGFQHANVIKCINGARKSHKGYTWRRELLENK